ncbi:hypothetical protein [Litorimonas sp.]|uniref:phage adaptor protein n=1 Tax=Litorimonas sp. TaxID=1892381 RepID=UPI003A848EC8
MTRADLINYVKRYAFNRTDLDDMMGVYISLAESEMRTGASVGQPLRLNAYKARTTLTPVDGVIVLPSDYAALIRASDGTCSLYYRTPETDYMTKTEFTVIGSDIHTSAKSVVLDYYKDFEPLVDDADTNVVLAKFLPVYLHGVLHQLYMNIDEADLASTHLAKFDNAIRAANAADNASQIPLEGMSIPL